MDQEPRETKTEKNKISPEFDQVASASLSNSIFPKKKKKPFSMKWRLIALSTAAMLLLTIIELNFNRTFAENAAKVPVIGGIARLVTVTEFPQDSTGETPQPALRQESTDIQSIVQEKMDAAGTAASVDGDSIRQFKSEIKYQSDDILSFVLYPKEPGIYDYLYYTVALGTGRDSSLADMLGPDYGQIVDANVKKQIADRRKEPNNTFFMGEFGFTGITEDPDFYLNRYGKVVVVFPACEISMTRCEFVIDPSLREYAEPTPSPTPTPTPTPTPSPTPTLTPAEYSTLLQETEKMDSDYFKSIYFIGDSRTVAMGKYHYVSRDRIFAQNGLNHVDAETNAFLTMDGQNVTIAQAVGSAKPDVAVISFGVNGIAWIDESKFMEEYQKLLDMLVAASPDTRYIIQSIYPVSNECAQKDSRLSNDKIDRYNQGLYDLAAKNHMYYLSTSDVLKAGDGSLLCEYDSGDGLHLNGTAYAAIFQYIKTHKLP